MAETPTTRRDSLDFRDHIYQPSLCALPARLLPKKSWLVLRDQGQEGACTGFGLAAVIDYMNRSQGIKTKVSARMLYEMAKRHDHWPGDDYEGSSARGAMKGWHKNGVCAETRWPHKSRTNFLTPQRQQAALAHPLGAYYRVLARRSDVHCALNETGVVFASAQTHSGWSLRKGDKGIIRYRQGLAEAGGHAFAIVGYTEDGFIIQNSWGKRWGGLKVGRTTYSGCALWSYEDFEANLWDAWVARMALPMRSVEALDRGGFTAVGGQSKQRAKAPPRNEIDQHYIHIDDGRFDPFGDYPSFEPEVRALIRRAVGLDGGKAVKHLLLYTHGGLNKVKEAASRVQAWRPVFAANAVHELHFIWETGLLAELGDVLRGKQDDAKTRAGGAGDWWDKTVERVSQPLGHPLWKEMQADADRAFVQDAAGSKTLAFLFEALDELPAAKRPQLHLVGHSAGSIWFARMLQRWKTLNGPAIDNLILFAPACTTDLYNQVFYPALKDKRIGTLRHYLLDDITERDDSVAKVYCKSLLYLVSRAYQDKNAIVPLMGMAIHLHALKTAGIAKARLNHYNTADHRGQTTACAHGGFDNDLITMNSMLGFVLGGEPPATKRFAKEHMEGY